MSTQATAPAQAVEISLETAAQPRPVSHRTMKRRMAVKVWYPKATDLPLVHLSEGSRAHVRRRLTPWLERMVFASDIEGRRGQRLGVEGGNCWQVAQSLVISAGDDSGVKYVEGVWTRPWELEEGEKPASHAWVSVDGHRVDLIKEFYSWKSRDDEWLYEPLAEFSHSRLVELYDGNPDYADADISTILWVNSESFEQEYYNGGSPDVYDIVFGPARERMKASAAMGAAA
jgi:hypothetical protein